MRDAGQTQIFSWTLTLPALEAVHSSEPTLFEASASASPRTFIESFAFVEAESAQVLLQALQKAATGNAVVLEVEIWLHGTRRLFALRVAPVYSPGSAGSGSTGSGINSSVHLLSVTGRDITEAREQEIQSVQMERRFRSLSQSGIVGIISSSLTGSIIDANDAFLKMLGYVPQELNAGFRWDRLTPDDQLPKDWLHIEEAKRHGFCTPYEKEYYHRLGHRVPVMIAYSLYEDLRHGALAICFVLDLSAQKEAEKRLRQGEQDLRLLADSMPQIVWTSNPDGQVTYMNRRWYVYAGVSETAPLLDCWMAALHPEDIQPTLEEWVRCAQTGDPYRVELRLREHTTGEYRWHLARSVAVRDEQGNITRWYGTSTDIQEQKEVEAELRSAQQKLIESRERLEFSILERTQALTNAIAEKEMLIKEVHHRVKNNLNVVTSLLSLQARQAKDPESIAAFQESKNRIDSIAIIHEKLYQSRNLASIAIGDYLEELLSAVLETFRRPGLKVDTSVHAPGIFLPIDTAIPCGLIVNELISNCLKHAFVGKAEGTIHIQMSESDDGYLLEVRDDGNGMDPHSEVRQNSLGLQLIRTLTRQLGGTMVFRRDGGTVFLLEFSDQLKGNRNVKALPFPGSLEVSSSEPPSASAHRLESESPSPAPL